MKKKLVLLSLLLIMTFLVSGLPTMAAPKAPYSNGIVSIRAITDSVMPKAGGSCS